MAKKPLAKMTIQQLETEIARRKKILPRLQKQRADLVKKLEEIDGRIADLTGGDVKKSPKKKPAPKHRRGKNKQSLVEVLVAVLKDKGKLGIREAVEAVFAYGYRSTSKTFNRIVNKTLSQHPKFQKVARGIYALKGKQTTAKKKAKKKIAKKAGKK
jgi:septal ring factor EnvC (AmiA/AmiB activator)